MGKILFANFLEDKRVYHLAYLFWKSFFQRLTSAVNLGFTTYLNTKGDCDGNPIFHAYLPDRQRALRIIQVDPSETVEAIDIKAWVDQVQLLSEETTVPELVIDMVLSEEAKVVGQKLIQAWVEAEQELDSTTIEGFLEQ